jgi:mRNA interferase MazF
MRRGEIWWAAMDVPTGSEPGYRRPTVIVSNNLINETEYQTLLMVTSNVARESAPGNVRLPRRKTGLRQPSVAITSQVVPVDKRRLLNRVGRIPDALMANIDHSLRFVLAL